MAQEELAEQYLNAAASAWRALDNPAGERAVDLALTRLDRDRGRFSDALARGTRLVEAARTAGDLAMQKQTLNLLATLSLDSGDYQHQIDFSRQVLTLEPAIDSLAYAAAVNNLGLAYCRLGELQICIEDKERAAAIYRARGASRELAGVLRQLSGIYQSMGDWEKAARVTREAGDEPSPYMLAKTGPAGPAIEAARKQIALLHQQGNGAAEAGVWMDLAGIYADVRESDQAAECLDQALEAIPRTSRLLAQFQYGVAKIFVQIGRHEKALELYRQFLAAGPGADIPNFPAMLGFVAREERDAGLLDEARTHIESALTRREAERARIVSPELAASFFSQTAGMTGVYIDVLMRQHERSPGDGHDAEALAASERARDYSLLASIGDAVSKVREGVDAKLLEREKSLQRELNLAATLQKTGHIDELSAELKLLRGEIRQASPRYASLIQPVSLSLQQIRDQVLTPNTALLEYSLGQERSYLWVVTSGSMRSFVLPPRSKIEPAVRRVYDLLTAPQVARTGETPAQKRNRVTRAEAAYPAAATALSRMLLEPAAGLLPGQRLLIVDEGALEYVPFSALPDPRSGNPLVEAHEIVRLPSASVLAALRDEVLARAGRPQTGIAVLADPVFEKNDERMGGARVSSPPAYPDDLTTSLDAAGPGASVKGLHRLVYSRREAANIAAAAPGGSVTRFLDFRASHATATSAALARYRIVHFATHGILNDEHPELSGLVLSLVDENGKSQDGFLRLHEIYNLRLPADLVVLSACDTALGKEIRGDGITSLSRGFMYAGAARVMASLWRVDDAATAEIMGRFYEKFLQENLRPAAALRAAQLEMERQPRWHFPYYWAAFELQGEWK
jgi:CHAT domain-containing protein